MRNYLRPLVANDFLIVSAPESGNPRDCVELFAIDRKCEKFVLTALLDGNGGQFEDCGGTHTRLVGFARSIL